MTTPLLTPPTVIPPALGPVRASHEADQLQADLKAAFMEVVEAMIRPRLSRLNVYGMAHLGDFEAVERFVKADGLALDRNNAKLGHMREVYRAWRALNPRRGLAFLRAYLALMYAAGSTVKQLWHPPNIQYPAALSETEQTGYYLTSRVRVTLAAANALSTAEMARVRNIMQSVLPARMVLDMYLGIGTGFSATPRVACTMQTARVVTFTGTMATV